MSILLKDIKQKGQMYILFLSHIVILTKAIHFTFGWKQA